MAKLPDDIIEVLLRSLRGEMTLRERSQLDELLAESPEFQRAYTQLQDSDFVHERLRRMSQIDQTAAFASLQRKLSPAPVRIMQPVPFLRSAWFRYAAAVILVFGIGGYFWIQSKNERPELTQTTPPVNNIQDIQPGANRAVLTLSDGRTIELDSLKARTYIEDGDAGIASDKGTLTYKGGETAGMNTMTTPKGGRYQLTLADGTKVWLNAASSITYPIAFKENTRKVTVTGEAYFEVVSNVSKPFIVNNGSVEIIVLGTHFNVNAYRDNGDMKVTLVEGSVQVKQGNAAPVLKPSQQAKVNQQVEVVNNVNVAEVMAWKNGVFNFNRLPLKDAMNEIARWYDIDVIYEGELPSFKFFGKIGRDLTLKQVLSGLSGLGLQFTLTNTKTLVISPMKK